MGWAGPTDNKLKLTQIQLKLNIEHLPFQTVKKICVGRIVHRTESVVCTQLVRTHMVPTNAELEIYSSLRIFPKTLSEWRVLDVKSLREKKAGRGLIAGRGQLRIPQ